MAPGSPRQAAQLAMETQDLCGAQSMKEGDYSFPGPESTEQEWARCFPIQHFPPLPKRGSKYYTEPFIGLAVVIAAIGTLVALTLAAAEDAGDLGPLLKFLIWLWAVVAGLCVAYLLFGDNREIDRAPDVCYPIPMQVAVALAHGQPTDNFRNADGPFGTSYCVRCLVWRPGDLHRGPGHHCSICQRCVEGFDHHCNVFGRCITKGNMPCFYALIAMLFAGVLTAAIALVAGTPDSPLQFLTSPTPERYSMHAAWRQVPTNQPVIVN